MNYNPDSGLDKNQFFLSKNIIKFYKDCTWNVPSLYYLLKFYTKTGLSLKTRQQLRFENSPLLESLKTHDIFFWFSMFIEMEPETLRIFFLGSSKRKFHHALVKAH